jgi:hypothetical protein
MGTVDSVIVGHNDKTGHYMSRRTGSSRRAASGFRQREGMPAAIVRSGAS